MTSAGRGGRRCGWSGSNPFCPTSPSLPGSGLCRVLESNNMKELKSMNVFIILAFLQYLNTEVHEPTTTQGNALTLAGTLESKRDLANKVKRTDATL